MTDTDSDKLVLNVECEVCGKELRLIIPLRGVELKWQVWCPDCAPKDSDKP